MPSFVSILHHLIIFLALCRPSSTCLGVEEKYGFTSDDQDVKVGSPIELECHLYHSTIEADGEVYHVNASHLTFVKGTEHKIHKIDAKNIHVVDTLTAKLRIESSKVEDSGLYYCKLILGSTTPVVCASIVNVGDVPQKSSIDFKCIASYRELECKWRTEPSRLKTHSTLKEVIYSKFRNPQYKKCPNLTQANNNTWLCKWSLSTIPPYIFNQEKFEFLVQTNNSFGRSKADHYHIIHNEIVLPPKPQGVEVRNKTEVTIELKWVRPLPSGHIPLNLLYQVLFKPKRKFSKWKVNNITERATEVFHNITGLVPNIAYDIVVRCRSPFAKGENMWSQNETIQVQTRPDVPYLAPNTTKQAFEIMQFQQSRTIIIRWEHISDEYWNGEGFHYVVSTHPISTKWEEKTTPSFPDKTVNVSYAIFGNLESNSAYYFKIFSANNHGLSRNFSTIIVESIEKLPNVPEDITVISPSQGKYNISWKPPSINSSSIKNYTLFWCYELRSRHCEGSIHWKHITKTNVLLSIPDEKANLQFAVAANSEKSSSGMEWALCIVSYNDIPDKISDISVDKKDSTSLHVAWKLECSAQKAIIKEFHLVYCKVAAFGSSNCIDGEPRVLIVSNNSAEDYLITDLVPFTFHRLHVGIVALNNHSVDSEYKYSRTLPGAPDDSPRDVKILQVTNSTVEVTWKPPKHPNGVITRYVVLYNSSSNNYSNFTTDNTIVLTELVPFTNYSIQLKACVNDKCSPLTEPVFVLTDIGIPGIMEEPRIEVVNASFAIVSWSGPFKPNGPIDFYILYIHPNKDYNVTATDSSYTETLNITGTTTSALVSVECPVIGKGIRYSFQLQPVNKLRSQLLAGEKTKPASTMMCLLYRDEGLSSVMIVSIVVGSAVGFAILLIVFYMAFRWLKKKYDLLKKIKVRLPTGLDTPNRCTPATYQDFKNDLLQHCPYPAQSKQRAGSFTLDARKNRHGSGNSQCSNISTDELLIKKSSRCDMYRRNPSGDSSSGCSSNGGHDSVSSSNTNQTHVSTDSGAEIDFPPLSAKDSVFSEQNLMQKLFFMPDLEVEDNDKLKLPMQHSSSEKNEDSESEKKPQMPACSSIIKNVPSSYSPCLQPYSKFGFNQMKDSGTNNCSRQWNMLAYVSNLANSEPSVAELDAGNSDSCSSSLMPYSKLTFSKSLENIHENSIGYSKCGTINDSTMNNFADSVKFPHYTLYQNGGRTGNPASITSSKYGYVGIEACLENQNKLSPLNKSTNSPTSSNISDPMAYSKFDIKPLGILSRTDPKTRGYIPIQQAMDISHITPCSPFDDISKELCPSNVSLPAEIMVSAIIEPCVEKCAISTLNSVPIDLCDNFFLYPSHTQDQETIPVSFNCGGTDVNQNNTALNEKECTKQYWKCASLSDININVDIRPEESHECDKPTTKAGEQANADEQTSMKSNYLKELEVVVSPGNLNYSTASLPAYRFHGQPDKVEPTNSKNGYVHISPVYYV